MNDTPRTESATNQAIEENDLSVLISMSAEIERENTKLARWILQHCDQWEGDHACAECFPGRDGTIKGFRCAVHVARTIDPILNP